MRTLEESQKHSWKDFFRLVLKSKLPWVLYLLTFIAMLLTSTVSLGSPLVLREIMSGNIFDKQIVMLFIGLSIAVALFVSISGFIRVYAVARTNRNIQETIWSKYIRVPIPFFNRNSSLLLISRLTHDPTHISAAVNAFLGVLTSTFQLVGAIIIMWNMDTKLTLVLLPVIPYILIVSFVVGHFTQRAQEGVQKEYSGMTAFFAERLPKIRLIKTFGKEKVEVDHGEVVIEKQYKADFSRAFVDLYAEPLMQSVQALITGLILIYGGYLTTQGALGIGSLIAFYLYSNGIQNNVISYGTFWQTLKAAKGAAHKISEIIDSDSESITREKSIQDVFEKSSGDIKLENVSFRYEERDVLTNVDFTIPEGKVTALVGPSGSGKTTILSLIERFYKPNVGQIVFGDTPVEKIHLDEWRNSLSYVSQGSPLLSGTIRENIIYGSDPLTSDEDIMIAAEKANATAFINEFPEGLDTEVGEMGSKLSGGQRQRIAIARAIMKNPKYLLLDEATSSLDAETSSNVQKGLNQLMKGRTTIVVAHNLSTIQKADQIVIIDDGKVSGVGKHEDLVESNDLYRDLVDIQFAKEQSLSW